MQYDERLGSIVMDQVVSLPFWQEFKNQVAVAIVGSVGAGIGDMLSDLDVYLFVPEKDSMPLYEHYKKGWQDGTIDVLNPRAFQFNEFPMVRFAEIDGHHRVMVFESLEQNVRNYEDVDRWVCLNSIPLHDPQGRLESLCTESTCYPAHILNRKLIRHYWLLCDNFSSTRKPLDRGQKETVSLISHQGISHLLKFCLLAEGKPYPYDKWLYRVAVQTKIGKKVRTSLEALFAELHRTDILYEIPQAYVKPGHRNEQYENYRIYHLQNTIIKILDENMPELQIDSSALLDRIGAWKPR